MFLMLLIVNKNGSLIYEAKLSKKLTIDPNQSITAASVFYSMYNIATTLTPTSLKRKNELGLLSEGIEVIEYNSLKLIAYQTLTNMKFIFIIDGTTSESECELMYKKLYDVYTDFASKNPLHETDNPIRINSFDVEVYNLFGVINE